MFGSHKGIPSLAVNRLARLASFLSQFEYDIEYRKTNDHANADALSRLPSGGDVKFDKEESEQDVDIVCTIQLLNRQVTASDSQTLRKETAKDPILSQVVRFVCEGWPVRAADEAVKDFRKLSSSLTTSYGCLLYGASVVIPESLRKSILLLLHEGHFGIERMKQLARTVVYWPNIYLDISKMCQQCDTCVQHQSATTQAPVHLWMMPEKPWSRIHVDHAIEFLGQHWLVMIDAYSKYPCIYQTTSVSTQTTINLLENSFTHFGYPQTIVSDNATTFTSDLFQQYYMERGIVHLTGAPYHSATNGAAERLIRTFKEALRKSSKPPKQALQKFLLMYRRTPTHCGYSPNELLNGRQISTKIDTLIPVPLQLPLPKKSIKKIRSFKVGDPVYALYYGPRRNRNPRWVSGVIVQARGTHLFHVQIAPNRPIWKRHIDQIRWRYASPENDEPGDLPTRKLPVPDNVPVAQPHISSSDPMPEYGRHNPRRSQRNRRPPLRYGQFGQ